MANRRPTTAIGRQEPDPVLANPLLV